MARPQPTVLTQVIELTEGRCGRWGRRLDRGPTEKTVTRPTLSDGN